MIKPILFNTQMVQAILEGRKTTTRRIIKVNNSLKFMGFRDNKALFGKGCCVYETIKPPYMKDILYVRETWLKADDDKYHYRADETPVSKEAREEFGYKWRPSIHMPKEAARIFLKVTDVRVERLQDMREKELRAEGITPDKEYEKFKHAAEANLEVKFATLWDGTINKKDLNKYGWEANPWVWVIEFERCEKPNE